jgi:RNA polymerase sigma-70 factor (ECF subfamily)
VDSSSALVADPTELASAVGPASSPRPTAQQVFQEHATYAWRALRYCGVAPADLQDACQEVFLVVHRRLPEFEQRSSMRTWVYGICLRVAAQYRRRAHRRHEELMPEPPEMAVLPTQPAEIEGQQTRALLEGVLATLDPFKRDVFVLYEIEQLPMEEVAAVVGCPLRTAYSRLEAARKQIVKAWQRAQIRSQHP